ncbi:MAG: glycosyltransferase [Bacteroidales bacterium]
MNFAASYLQRYVYRDKGFIANDPDPDTFIIITIPAYREEKLLYTLESLLKCELPPLITEIIILINYPDLELTDSFYQNQYYLIRNWAEQNSSTCLLFYPVIMALPAAEAGVGLARKILMDEAVFRFSKINRPQGIIVGLDADCLCEKNYLQELYTFFQQRPHLNTCSIYFEHPLEGEEYSRELYEAIAIYELYLRYHVEGLRFAGFPFAFHTIGSAFAVRAAAYVKQGGMNRRKAGEDFYFLNKMMLLGGYGELNTTVVYPAPRLSDRVPFGTGAAIHKIAAGSQEYLYTWNPQVFAILKDFITVLPDLYARDAQISFHPILTNFLEKNQWTSALNQARTNAGSEHTFIKRIWHWFDGLKALQFIRFAHQQGLSRVHLSSASLELLRYNGFHAANPDIKSILYHYRSKQRKEEHTLSWAKN